MIGSTIETSIVSRRPIGEIDGVDVEIRAAAWIVAEHEFFIEPGDPLGDGFDW
jgi:proline racemase